MSGNVLYMVRDTRTNEGFRENEARNELSRDPPPPSPQKYKTREEARKNREAEPPEEIRAGAADLHAADHRVARDRLARVVDGLARLHRELAHRLDLAQNLARGRDSLLVHL